MPDRASQGRNYGQALEPGHPEKEGEGERACGRLTQESDGEEGGEGPGRQEPWEVGAGPDWGARGPGPRGRLRPSFTHSLPIPSS